MHRFMLLISETSTLWLNILYYYIKDKSTIQKSPEALRSQIDLKRHYVQTQHVVELTNPLQTGCIMLTLLA